MANRVVLGALPGGGFGLRVSRPGRNVLNNNLSGSQVAFDSRWQASGRLVINGNVAVPNTDSSSTVEYGVTLPQIPEVLLLFRNASDSSQWTLGVTGDTGISRDVRQTQNTIGLPNYSEINAWLDPANVDPPVQIFNDRFVFRHGWYSWYGYTGDYDFVRYGDRLSYVVIRTD